MSDGVHDLHPMKVSDDSIESEGTLKADDGWIDMNVKFLITRDSVNSQQTVFGITVFPPGAKHDIHRHPHAEVTEYIVEGHGVARVGDDDVSMRPGDVVFVPTNEYHGFLISSTSERAVMVWCYGGAASLEQAGYITVADDNSDT
jgi:quercetin dioxygenase-like cupin family protein